MRNLVKAFVCIKSSTIMFLIRRRAMLSIMLALALASCDSSHLQQKKDVSKNVTQHYGGLTLRMSFLPAADVQKSHEAPIEANEQLSSFYLEIINDTSTPLPDLLMQAAPPTWTAGEVQNALFYKMEQAATLKVGEKTAQAIAAVTEMNIDNSKKIKIIFTFPITENELYKAHTSEILLDKAFFLPEPLRFVFDTSAIKSASR